MKAMRMVDEVKELELLQGAVSSDDTGRGFWGEMEPLTLSSRLSSALSRSSSLWPCGQRKPARGRVKRNLRLVFINLAYPTALLPVP